MINEKEQKQTKFTEAKLDSTWSWFGFSIISYCLYMIWKKVKFDVSADETALKTVSHVKLEEVVGIEEYRKELEQIIDFIRNPGKYKEIGAVIPKGVLLSGEPGIGKTMIAKALATETNINFIYKSGSEFDTKYLGESSKNVKKIFQLARSSKPCILFIDEIDSIGGKRSKKEHQMYNFAFDGLNQILHEMDGFDKDEGVLVVAATNRIGDLDPALLRPGRFDKILRIPTPNKKAREELMQHYMKKIKLDRLGFDPKYFMDRTSGFTGAEIKNVFNIAALNAGYHSQELVSQFDVETAIDRVIHGNQPKTEGSNVDLLEKVAHSEAATAVLAFQIGQIDKINKINLNFLKNPRNKSGMIENEKLDIFTQQSLYNQMQLYLACKVAEEMKYGSDFASFNCLERTRLAGQLAHKYVSNNFDVEKNEKEEKIAFYSNSQSIEFKGEIENRTQSVLNQVLISARQIMLQNVGRINSIAKELLEKKSLSRENILTFLNEH